MEKISLAIPTFNRTNFVIESFQNVLGDDRISEIVIRDDFSNINEYSEMVNLIKKINNKK